MKSGLLSGTDRERGRPTVGRLVVDEQSPCEPFSTRKRQRPEVDSERNPQLAPGCDTRRSTCFELTIEADRLVAHLNRVSVLVGQIESPLMFDVRLIPGNADSYGDRNLLWARSNDTQAATEDEEFAVVDLHGIRHQDDGAKCGRVEHEVRLIHCVDPIGQRWPSGIR